MALTKKEFITVWDLSESRKDGALYLVDKNGRLIAYVCPDCGKVQASKITCSAGVLQPEYCQCFDDKERRG